MATTAASSRLLFGMQLPGSIAVLGERDFRVVWTGQAISMTGTWMQVIAQSLLVLELWDSAFALGAVNFSNAVPSLIIMLFGGVLADRADKRKILLVTQIAMAGIALCVGLLVLTDLVEIWVIIIATALVGVAFGYDMPAYQAFLPELVPPEEISQVVSLNSATFHGSRMVGPAIAGAVIKAFGLATAYLLNAASFLAVIFGLLIVRGRHEVPAHAMRGGSAIEGLREGMRHAQGRPNVQVMLTLTALACAFIFPTMAILSPFYVKNVLHGGPGTLGALWAASGVGSLIGAMALIWWPRQHRTLRIRVATVLGPAGLVIMAVTRDPVVAIVASGMTSVAFSSQLNMYQAMLQESTPREYRGRVMSLHGIAFNGTMPIAGIASAALAVWLGLPWVMALSAGVYLVLSAWVLRFAGGGIENVVQQCRVQYEQVMIAGATAMPSGAPSRPR